MTIPFFDHTGTHLIKYYERIQLKAEMLPTFIDWNPLFVVQRIVTGKENMKARKGGKIPLSRPGAYFYESFVTVVESFLLADRVYFDPGFFKAHPSVLQKDNNFFSGKLAFDFLEARKAAAKPSQKLFPEESGEFRHLELESYARAYNGRYGPVCVALPPQARAFFEVDRYLPTNAALARSQPQVIQKAYSGLAKQYKAKVSSLVLNQSKIIIPPLAATMLSRLPDGCDDLQVFSEELLRLRKEIEPARVKFGQFQEALDNPDYSIGDMQKICKAIEADAKHFASKWDSYATDNTIVQFCLDKVSFLYKVLIKQSELEPEELLSGVSKIAPWLEKRLLTPTPTVLAQLALKSRKIKGIESLFKRKFGIDPLK